MSIIDGSRLMDGRVLTPAVKSALVKRLQETHSVNVWAFGYSVVYLSMLKQADQAIVVVVVANSTTRCDDGTEKALEQAAVDIDGFRARQVLLSPKTKPRLKTPARSLSSASKRHPRLPSLTPCTSSPPNLHPSRPPHRKHPSTAPPSQTPRTVKPTHPPQQRLVTSPRPKSPRHPALSPAPPTRSRKTRQSRYIRDKNQTPIIPNSARAGQIK